MGERLVSRLAVRGRRLVQCGFVTGILLFSITSPTKAADDCEPVVGRVASAEGNVEVQRGADAPWTVAKLNQVLCEGDSVRAAERSRAAITLANQAVLRVDQNSAVRLVNVSNKPEERSFVDLIRGAIQSFSRKPRRLEVSTPYLNGSIEGTEFVLRVSGNQTILTVFEGTVRAANPQGSVAVTSGQSVAAEAGKAPQPRTVVRPRDAAQWALYYPPILATGSEKEAPELLRQAARSLSVGSVESARADIDRILSADSKSSLALALRSVINVVQNNSDQALTDANQAVTLNPDASAPRIALSYAQQAKFQISQARDTLLEAVKRQPNDALAWARLAELHLMLGERDRSREAAQKASALAPDLARTQITSGFSALAEFRTDDAKVAFERAVNLNSADPLPHLGLGLSRIGAGELAEGRREIEVAVALDGNSALLRAYLGKAYFDEKRRPLDGEQFSIAKELDPLDPTAFLYDGIRKQTENQPVAALQDLEDSIERNNNRAAYRGRLLLDKDRAARGTSLARVYSDLGFADLAANESADSLALDPADASAHRFLSDTYQNVRRREISRVSELLQAQMLQDINVNPVQPSISEANLNIVTLGGPSSAGFNEFTPLFQRNQAQFNLAGLAGDNGTAGGEAVVSALYGRYSLSAGAFSYKTDGWRPNNGLEQDAYNVFAQAAITDKLNVQAEYRHRKSTEGDLPFNFDPNDFLSDKKTERQQDTARVGLRYSANPHSHFLLSFIHSDRDENLNEVQLLPPDPFLSPDPFVFTDKTRRNDKGDQTEVQYIGQGSTWNLIVGASYNDTNRHVEPNVSLFHPLLGELLPPADPSDTKLKQRRGYWYGYINPTSALKLTVGASYDNYEEGTLKEFSFNPKLGVQWNVTNDVRVRAAAFRNMKPALVNNRMLEPTQVAGFNQLYDDINATKSDRYAGGVDWRLSRNLATGVELTKRNIEEPTFDFFANDWIFEKREEKYHKLYLNWTPASQLAVRAELVYDRYAADSGIATDFANIPEEVTTVSVPIGVTYFSPVGVFAGITATYVDQQVRRSVLATQASGDSTFTLLDAAIGYRFPRRLGMASLGVKNLFDRKFNYQDDSYREFRDEPTVGPYFPTRTIVGRVSLNF